MYKLGTTDINESKVYLNLTEGIFSYDRAGSSKIFSYTVCVHSRYSEFIFMISVQALNVKLWLGAALQRYKSVRHYDCYTTATTTTITTTTAAATSSTTTITTTLLLAVLL